MKEVRFFQCSVCKQVTDQFLEDRKNGLYLNDEGEFILGEESKNYFTPCNHTIYVVCKSSEIDEFIITPFGVVWSWSTREYQEHEPMPINQSYKVTQDALKERDRARQGVANLNEGIDQMLINAGQKAIDAEKREKVALSKLHSFENSIFYKLWSFFDKTSKISLRS